MIKTKETRSISFGAVAKPLLISILCGAAMIAALLSLAAFVLLKVGQIGASVTGSIVVVICAASAIFAGAVAGRLFRKNGLIIGSMIGALLYFLLFVVSVSCGAFPLFTAAAVTRFAVMVIGGALGGLLSVNQRRKAK